MNNRSLYTAALVLALGASFSADRASAYCRMTTQGGAQVGDLPCVEKGAPFIWNDPCPSYALDYRGSVWMDFEDVQAAVDASFDTWEQADCGGSGPGLSFTGLRSSTCQRAEYNTSGGNVNTIAFLGGDLDGDGGDDAVFKDPCADKAFSQFAFAVTIVWHNTSTGEIFDADMMINDVFATGRAAGGPYANCPDTGCEGTDADLASIVTHEIGHFIGIGHSEVADATMYASADRSSVAKRSLGQDDRDAVCGIYPPGTLDESCNSAPRGGLELNCETDANGAPIACEDPASQGGGCSATRAPADVPWAPLLAVLLGLTVLRRRSGRRDARS